MTLGFGFYRFMRLMVAHTRHPLPQKNQGPFAKAGKQGELRAV